MAPRAGGCRASKRRARRGFFGPGEAPPARFESASAIGRRTGCNVEQTGVSTTARRPPPLSLYLSLSLGRRREEEEGGGAVPQGPHPPEAALAQTPNRTSRTGWAKVARPPAHARAAQPTCHHHHQHQQHQQHQHQHPPRAAAVRPARSPAPPPPRPLRCRHPQPAARGAPPAATESRAPCSRPAPPRPTTPLS